MFSDDILYTKFKMTDLQAKNLPLLTGWKLHVGRLQIGLAIVNYQLSIKLSGGAKRMARINGVDLPREKRVEIGLTYIYGIGRAKSNQILSKTGINPDTRVRDLTDDEISRLRENIDRDHKVEGDLRREIALNIKRLIEIGCYRGRRHRMGLPVRGQKTKTNARTRKGPKKTVGVQRKK